MKRNILRTIELRNRRENLMNEKTIAKPTHSPFYKQTFSQENNSTLNLLKMGTKCSINIYVTVI